MAQVVEVQPMFLDVIQDVIRLHQNVEHLKRISSQTMNLRRVTAELPDNGPGLGDGEEVAGLRSHQENSLASVTALLAKNEQALSAVLAGYLSEHRINKGMTLVDDWEGKPFVFKAMTLHCDVSEPEELDSPVSSIGAESVYLWMGEAKGDARISIPLVTGSSVTVDK